VRDPGQAVELDVVLRRDAAQHAARALAQGVHFTEMVSEPLHRGARCGQQLAHVGVARGIGGAGLRRGLPAALDLAQPVLQRVDQQRAALGAVEQVVFEVRIALQDPDVAQHLVQHARRAAGAALLAQQVQQLPRAHAQQALHDLPVGERGVVVRNLAQAGRGVRSLTRRVDGAEGAGKA